MNISRVIIDYFEGDRVCIKRESTYYGETGDLIESRYDIRIGGQEIKQISERNLYKLYDVIGEVLNG